jgi:hypothetical protein
MNLCCNCKEWRGTGNDEYDKCHINKCGFLRYDNYCKKHDLLDGVDVDRFKEQFDFNPQEVEVIER